mmetsp:Transcript_69769/g.204602  ORF Transcript_69769/g.204602 Transcript_69769/m.204602 type:complete len:230 (+) Transcript_69769:586-1275(+)
MDTVVVSDLRSDDVVEATMLGGRLQDLVEIALVSIGERRHLWLLLAVGEVECHVALEEWAHLLLVRKDHLSTELRKADSRQAAAGSDLEYSHTLQTVRVVARHLLLHVVEQHLCSEPERRSARAEVPVRVVGHHVQGAVALRIAHPHNAHLKGFWVLDSKEVLGRLQVGVHFSGRLPVFLVILVCHLHVAPFVPAGCTEEAPIHADIWIHLSKDPLLTTCAAMPPLQHP